MENEMVQNLEWLEAQNIEISIDLFAAAKEHLQFLKAVDQNQWLSDGIILERAIYRYNAYWLPLLAKYSECSSICEGPLVPPLDCEWVWHCHRLNPVRYMSDCEQFYGRLLGNSGIVSSVSGSCTLQTKALWKRLYRMESYDLDVDNIVLEPKDISALKECTTYDLFSAVKRQISFYNEVKLTKLQGMENEMVQNKEWLEAQKIEISIDLFAAAKEHLQFLEAVHQNQWLYDGIILDRAIYRYNAYWLPLLAKYCESSSICEGPLVPPLDCEWVWHYQRLNPVRYMSDCEQFYGRLLGNSGIVSSASGGCTLQTEALWNSLYPMESYELDVDNIVLEQKDLSTLEKCTTYDLFSAVKRQISFYYEIFSDHVDNDIIVKEAVGRYKAFLHLIKRNQEKSIHLFNVPTYDIDLMWHTHQLNPSAYHKDLKKIFGNILQHDDTDSYKSEGTKLNTGFSATTAQWEETFSQRYWKPTEETTTDNVAAEKHGAGARGLAMDTEKHGGGARCLAKAVEKKSARCIPLVAEKKSARCIPLVAEKKSARCIPLVAANKSSKCTGAVVAAEKKSAKCAVMAAEKKSAKCAVLAAEKKSAKCAVLAAEKKSAKCAVLAAEIKSAKFAVETAKNKSAKCAVLAAEKKSVKCAVLAAEKKSAKCAVVAVEKNGGCGNVMKNNADENASLGDALNSVVAA